MARKPRNAIAPDMPPSTEEELALERSILIGLQALTAGLRQRNLDNAVLLAQQAARGRGPLVDHFAELGRRYAASLDEPEKPKLRLVKGRYDGRPGSPHNPTRSGRVGAVADRGAGRPGQRLIDRLDALEPDLDLEEEHDCCSAGECGGVALRNDGLPGDPADAEFSGDEHEPDDEDHQHGSEDEPNFPTLRAERDGFVTVHRRRREFVLVTSKGGRPVRVRTVVAERRG